MRDRRRDGTARILGSRARGALNVNHQKYGLVPGYLYTETHPWSQTPVTLFYQTNVQAVVVLAFELCPSPAAATATGVEPSPSQA
ncbi:hypothetical protein LMH87_006298 [Akanthomyces muscarius]|uniref:Uncharacterized protein n=1 Tax=Akanthomyces muscarius TaxID=2231603 RepID=A0A9W8USP4_AKAMU|nr:hypothetical protein LMH87_006298 [Akanthomyces muscarius]KAJ4164635.1 hypothetical protein LMH87_006298 [Akanthomyces muscarius]